MFCKNLKKKLFLALLTLTLIMLPITARALVANPIILSDSFNTTLWRWKTLWGKISIVNINGSRTLSLSSTRPTKPAQTFSALAISKKTAGNFSFAVTTKTVKQLRLNTRPNPWEVGWIFFRYRDLENYYYFILKPNGYELGKKHGSDAQIFLATGESPKLQINRNYRIKVIARGSNIRAYVDGKKILDYTDPRPILSGAVGLYEEDALVRFDNVVVTKL